ncbi:11-S seed storage protein, plant [Corchorus olitorius]|uniref:11-S seed storage protein, plant n=1 Tax=Corchorus olitorius TaxID=93759 RepID=A0A1R3K385_9ROSI|nr:11-S seed storage protein, plant [Corchorus olitorius]
MDLNLSPKFPRVFAEAEGAGIYNWAASDSPVLAQAKLAAGKLIMKPGGLALPHYADCSKIGYVLEGNCGVGLTLQARTKDKTVFMDLRKGDIIPIPKESISWWYNHGNSDLEIVFMGDSSNAYFPAEITYFFLAGAMAPFAAFSPGFIAKTYNLSIETAEQLGNSQKSGLLIKVDEEEAKGIPKPNQDLVNIWTRNIDSSNPDVEVENGGKSTTLTAIQFPFLEEVGLSFCRLVLEPNATRAPGYASESRMFFVAKGSGKVQIVGIQGKLVLNTKVEAGQIFVVPKLFMVTISADEGGMELASIVKSAR